MTLAHVFVDQRGIRRNCLENFRRFFHNMVRFFIKFVLVTLYLRVPMYIKMIGITLTTMALHCVLRIPIIPPYYEAIWSFAATW